MKRLKVLFLTSWYPFEENPILGIFIREHAKAVQLYDDVVVLHLIERAKNIPSVWKIEEDHRFHFTEGVPIFRVRSAQSKVPNTSYFIFLYSVLAAYMKLVKQGFQPDILHAHIYRAGVPAVLIGKIFRKPVIITEHTSSFARHLLPKLEVRKARFAFQNANIVLPVSKALQQGIESYHIHAHYQIVPNVVDTNIFHLADKPIKTDVVKEILFVGSLTSIKGVDILLHALSTLKERRNGWHANIVGGGDQLKEYQELSIKLGLIDQVTFHGLQDKQIVASFMRQADLFVLPSRWESQGCVLIEAMSCGLPIVASKTGGIPEIIDPETGILVTPEDPQALCEAIATMLDKNDFIDHEQIARKAQRFSQAEVGKLIDSIYRQFL